ERDAVAAVDADGVAAAADLVEDQAADRLRRVDVDDAAGEVDDGAVEGGDLPGREGLGRAPVIVVGDVGGPVLVGRAVPPDAAAEGDEAADVEFDVLGRGVDVPEHPGRQLRQARERTAAADAGAVGQGDAGEAGDAAVDVLDAGAGRAPGTAVGADDVEG